MSGPESITDHLKRYGSLAYGAFGTMMDIGLIVLGTLLVGLGVATLLAGFDLVGTLEDMSTGAMLGSALILAVVGMFALGLAAEGPLGRGRRLDGFGIWEVGIGRAIAAFLVGFGLLILDSLIVNIIADLPDVFARGSDGIHAVAVAGMIAVPLIGVPLSLLVRSLPDAYASYRRFDLPTVFVVWLITTLILL